MNRTGATIKIIVRTSQARCGLILTLKGWVSELFQVGEKVFFRSTKKNEDLFFARKVAVGQRHQTNASV